MLPVPEPPEPVRKVTADHLDRAERAWTVRVAGGSWRQAAQVAGYSDDQAAMKGVRTCYGMLPKPTREDLRDLWRDRLEKAWRQVCVDMAEQRAGATTAAVRVANMAIQLDGLAEPVRVNVGVEATFAAIEQELGLHGL
jgi:hypothetical protein